jgi:hypothetical protein
MTVAEAKLNSNEIKMVARPEMMVFDIISKVAEAIRRVVLSVWKK